MPGIARLLLALACGGSIGLMSDPARAAVPEWNPVRSHAVQLGPEASRLMVGFPATEGNTVVKAVRHRTQAHTITNLQSNTPPPAARAPSSRMSMPVFDSIIPIYCAPA